MMKWIAFGVVLSAGCVATAFSAPTVTPRDDSSVSIVVEHENNRLALMMVSLRAETVRLTPPLRFHWSLGNGREWEGMQPPPQMYMGGRYDVILTVTDAVGRVRKASVKIDAHTRSACGS